MTTEGHIAALERRHQELERQIDVEMAHLSHDDLLIAALKRKKLEVKDELQKLQAHAAEGDLTRQRDRPGLLPGPFFWICALDQAIPNRIAWPTA